MEQWIVHSVKLRCWWMLQWFSCHKWWSMSCQFKCREMSGFGQFVRQCGLAANKPVKKIMLKKVGEKKTHISLLSSRTTNIFETFLLPTELMICQCGKQTGGWRVDGLVQQILDLSVSGIREQRWPRLLLTSINTKLSSQLSPVSNRCSHIVMNYSSSTPTQVFSAIIFKPAQLEVE